jgi:nucleotide-binding universal stress UspA family protein
MALIVVGVDGSPAAREALRFAAEEARLRGATLRVVNAWLIPLFEGMPMPIVGGMPVDYGRPLEEVTELTRAASERLIEAEVGQALAGATDIEVERVPAEGAPAAALLEAARGADLLVVGSRGRGGFAGLLLGSVSQQCAHHSPCPVVIVHPPPEE